MIGCLDLGFGMVNQQLVGIGEVVVVTCEFDGSRWLWLMEGRDGS